MRKTSLALAGLVLISAVPAAGVGQTATSVKVNTVGSLAAAGFTVQASISKPTDAKQMIVTMQKGGDVYFCPVWIDKPGVTADACAKAF